MWIYQCTLYGIVMLICTNVHAVCSFVKVFVAVVAVVVVEVVVVVVVIMLHVVTDQDSCL